MSDAFKVGDRVRLATPRAEYNVETAAVPAGSVGTLTAFDDYVDGGAYVAFDDVPDHPLFALFGGPAGWAVFTDELALHTDEQKDES